jgi:hypothetical protein
MTQLRNTFDAESLGALESVLNDIDRELASEPAAGEDARPVISRERLAKLICTTPRTASPIRRSFGRWS